MTALQVYLSIAILAAFVIAGLLVQANIEFRLLERLDQERLDELGADQDVTVPPSRLTPRACDGPLDGADTSEDAA